MMKNEIVEMIKNLSTNLVSETGSWVMFGEKTVPKEIVDEYNDKNDDN